MYNCYNCMNQTDVRVTEYTQGTFIIDMIDRDANASVWRSVTQSKLKDETIRDQTALDSAAMRVLAGFPPPAQCQPHLDGLRRIGPLVQCVNHQVSPNADAYPQGGT